MSNVLLSPDTQALLLLCGHFGGRHDEKPLTLSEYNRLASWLRNERLRPKDLLTPEGDAALDRLPTKGAAPDRLRSLLERGAALGFAVEDWDRQGLWVLSRADPAYPHLLKERLKTRRPPLLFGAGRLGLLDTPALGIVGSRDADEAALQFTRAIAQRCAAEGVAVISGGAKGVDQVSVEAVLEAGGTAIVVPAEGVAKLAVRKAYRPYLAEARLVLLSPFHPKARWTIGNAMGRNRLVYALSAATLAVSSGTKGGTWNGALENLKHGWAPLLVREGDTMPEGNRQLIRRGGRPFSLATLDQASSLRDYLASATPAVRGGDGTIDMFAVSEPEPESPQPADSAASDDLFPMVWPRLAPAFSEEVTTQDLNEMAYRFNVQVGQLQAWLKQAVEQGLVEKRNRPVRYVLPSTQL